MSFALAAQPLEDLRKLLTSIISVNEYKDESNVINWLQAVANAKDDKQINTHRSLITLFASSNGIADEVSTTPTIADLRTIMDESAAGNARLNKMCEIYGHGLRIFDLALDMSTKKAYLEPTLGEKQCAATVAFGMEAIAGGADILAVGTLATAADETAAAVIMAIMPELATVIEAEMQNDFALLSRIANSVETGQNAIEVLAAIGGREIAAIMGAIISARTANIPVILDDLSALTAALVLHQENPHLISHCRLAICQTQLMSDVIEILNLKSVVATDSPRLTGANSALAMGVIKANVAAQ